MIKYGKMNVFKLYTLSGIRNCLKIFIDTGYITGVGIIITGYNILFIRHFKRQKLGLVLCTYVCHVFREHGIFLEIRLFTQPSNRMFSIMLNGTVKTRKFDVG